MIWNLVPHLHVVILFSFKFSTATCRRGTIGTLTRPSNTDGATGINLTWILPKKGRTRPPYLWPRCLVFIRRLDSSVCHALHHSAVASRFVCTSSSRFCRSHKRVLSLTIGTKILSWYYRYWLTKINYVSVFVSFRIIWGTRNNRNQICAIAGARTSSSIILALPLWVEYNILCLLIFIK